MPQLPHSGASAPAPIRAAGTRRINLDMRARLDQADNFTGFPRGTTKPFELLTAFEQAEPYLGLPPHAYKLIGFLVRQTRPQDWEEGSRPIAWPSDAAARYAGAAGRVGRRAKTPPMMPRLKTGKGVTGAVRYVLGGAAQRVIRTVPRKGVRFVAEVREYGADVSRVSDAEADQARVAKQAT